MPKAQEKFIVVNVIRARRGLRTGIERDKESRSEIYTLGRDTGVWR